MRGELRTLGGEVITLPEFTAWKLIRYTAKEMIEDVWKPFFFGTVMGGAVAAVGSFFLDGVSNTLSLIVKVLIGVAVYILLSVVFKQAEFSEILQMLKDLGKRKGDND